MISLRSECSFVVCARHVKMGLNEPLCQRSPPPSLVSVFEVKLFVSVWEKHCFQLVKRDLDFSPSGSQYPYQTQLLFLSSGDRQKGLSLNEKIFKTFIAPNLRFPFGFCCVLLQLVCLPARVKGCLIWW